MGNIALKSVGGAAVEAVGVPAYQTATCTITAAQLAALPDPATSFTANFAPAIPATARIFGAVADVAEVFGNESGPWVRADLSIEDSDDHVYVASNVDAVGEKAMGATDFTTNWSGKTMTVTITAVDGAGGNLHNATTGDMTIALYYSEVG